ncbi:uncharacterized protein SCDLUD_002073 [Saccharomycodes ludwigii]|uniref:uncharacterized protein n=1 Tax=Saccharomycodes ludwigii TaxID=36035 RepID=UPI001E87B077|nr:hypothetical protein SCDLUD_002073 [Saccharomycodes ludwigii]KAH3902256.1 hypothetical protein SCDLUD_002073 [Saccharomycodes ludwigii]
MSHAIIISNIPVEVTNQTLQSFIETGDHRFKGIKVSHIQEFPDVAHSVSADGKTKTIQAFFKHEDDALNAGELFEDEESTYKLIALQEKNNGGKKIHHNGKVKTAKA